MNVGSDWYRSGWHNNDFVFVGDTGFQPHDKSVMLTMLALKHHLGGSVVMKSRSDWDAKWTNHTPSWSEPPARCRSMSMSFLSVRRCRTSWTENIPNDHDRPPVRRSFKLDNQAVKQDKKVSMLSVVGSEQKRYIGTEDFMWTVARRKCRCCQS